MVFPSIFSLWPVKWKITTSQYKIPQIHTHRNITTCFLDFILSLCSEFLYAFFWVILGNSPASGFYMPEPESPSPYPQVPATCPYPEPTPSNPHDPPPTSWRSILILSSHLRLGLPNGLFPSGFPTNTLCGWTLPDTVNTVKCTWWWAKTSPETCRADKEK